MNDISFVVQKIINYSILNFSYFSTIFLYDNKIQTQMELKLHFVEYDLISMRLKIKVQLRSLITKIKAAKDWKKMNPDIESERKNSSINLEKMKQFLGEILYGSNYPKLMTQSI